MECNKDEAFHAQQIAEKKLVEKDFVGAKKFALKAQALNPTLESVSHTLVTLDVYMAGEKKVRGEVDWYGILGVTPMADEGTMRSRYKKLAIMLHPDKNRSVGADGAFKLISQAWTLLSDKGKRLAYNQRRGLVMCIPKTPSSVAKGSFPAGTATNVKTQVAANERKEAFWTSCNGCRMQYEYARIFLNRVLRCPTCQQSFVASETNPPANLSKQRNLSSDGPQSNMENAARSQHSDLRKSGSSNLYQHMMSQQSRSTYIKPVVGIQATNVVPQTNILKRKENHGWDMCSAVNGDSTFKKAKGLEEHNKAVAAAAPIGGSSRSILRPRRTNNQAASFSFGKLANRMIDLTPIETRKMLLKKAQLDIRKKVEDLKAESLNVQLKENTKDKEETTAAKGNSDSKRRK